MEIELVSASESPIGIETALSWALDLWGDHIPNYSRQDWTGFYRNSYRANYQHWEGSDQELVYFGMNGKEIVGTISLVDFDDLEEFRHFSPWIAAFIVNPSFRGEGVGTKMLALLEDKARALGISALHLWTEDQSEFYRKRGYQLLAGGKYGELKFEVLRKFIG